MEQHQKLLNYLFDILVLAGDPSIYFHPFFVPIFFSLFIWFLWLTLFLTASENGLKMHFICTLLFQNYAEGFYYFFFLSGLYGFEELLNLLFFIIKT